jgi:uncharacterized protein (TIGR02246 family)
MEAGIHTAGAALADALARGNAVEAAALYTEDGKVLTPAAQLIEGRRQIEAFWRAGLAVGLAGVDLEAEGFEAGPDYLLEIGRYRLTVADDRGAPTVDSGKYLALHRRQADGSWRRAVDVFNPDMRKEER